MKVKYAIAASGNGTVFQSIIDAQKKGLIPCGEIVCLFSDNANAGALDRAKTSKIPAFYIDHKTDPEKRDEEILKVLKTTGAQFLFLAGYIKKISTRIINYLPIYNTHPALDLGRFGGKGMYGIKVHESVIEANEKVTGSTIHRVDTEYDSGNIMMQSSPVKVEIGDSPETLQKKVQAEEYILVPKFLDEITRSFKH